MKKKPKSDKPKITKQSFFYIVIIVLTVFNIFFHRKNSVYLYYEENINQLKNDLQEYQKRINREIIGHLLTLTNLYIQNLISNNYYQVSEDTTLPPSPIPINYDSISVSNYPLFKFDGYFEVNHKPYVISGNRYYTNGDYINGLRILSISPQFVQIGNQFYAVDKPIKRQAVTNVKKELKK